MNIWLALLLVFGGGFARILIPYLQKWVASKVAFDWRYVVGAVLALIVSMFPVVLVDSVLAELQIMSIPSLLAWGWAFTDAGREAQKWVEMWRSSR
jgi:hypothetical protein